MTVMAILQDVDKCIRCNGCVIACKREWNLKLPTNIADVIPQKSIVSPRQRLAIKSTRRGRHGSVRPLQLLALPRCPVHQGVSVWSDQARDGDHGAVSVNSALCQPTLCKSGTGPRPCEIGCQQGGYPKVGVAYETGPYAGQVKMNKCTLCTGRAGADDRDPNSGRRPPRFRQRPPAAEVCRCPREGPPAGVRLDVPGQGHEVGHQGQHPCVPQRSGQRLHPGQRHSRTGSAAAACTGQPRRPCIVPPKADPFIEDHLTPMVGSMVSGGSKLMIPALLLGGFAVVSMRRAKVEAEASDMSVREV